MATISTPDGERDENLFIRKDGIEDRPDDIVNWVEWWDGVVLVNRVEHITKKGGVA